MQQGDNEKLKWKLDQTPAKLIYFGDPMCSWCWGISWALDKLVRTFQKELSFEIVMGGLRPGGGDPWNDEMKQFLRTHWNHVNTASGQKFKYRLLNLDSFNYDTEPPCRSVVVVRALKPEVEYDFFKAIQYRFYVQNEDPGQEEFYKPLCKKFSIPFNQFSTLFESEEFMEKVKEDFNKSRQYGIRGFPAIVFQKHGEVKTVTNGFATFETLAERVSLLLKQHA